MQNLGKSIVVIGSILLVIGLILWFAGNKFSWFGNLPGDIKVKSENFSFYMPITTMILVSIVLSIILWLIRKFF
jgi:hypothetical protein